MQNKKGHWATHCISFISITTVECAFIYKLMIAVFAPSYGTLLKYK